MQRYIVPYNLSTFLSTSFVEIEKPLEEITKFGLDIPSFATYFFHILRQDIKCNGIVTMKSHNKTKTVITFYDNKDEKVDERLIDELKLKYQANKLN